MRVRTLLICIFIFSANSILAADKTSVEPTLVLEQQVLALQKEVAILKSMLEKITADQSKQQSYIQIINNELVVEATKNTTISAKDQLTLKSGDASIVLKKNGDIFMSGEKFDIKKNNDISVKGSKITAN